MPFHRAANSNEDNEYGSARRIGTVPSQTFVCRNCWRAACFSFTDPPKFSTFARAAVQTETHVVSAHGLRL